jgi:hypothetical protein
MKRTELNESSGKSERENLIDGALFWAGNNVPVFPCSMSKRPLTENGFYDATTDPALIRHMFDCDNVLIGARMGAAAGMFAIDFDLYKEAGAQEFMNELIERELLPQTRTHKTTSGGVHMLYRAKDCPSIAPIDGVDVKGEGGYIIVPPSAGYSVMSEGLTNAPDGLIDYLKAKRKTLSAVSAAGIKAKIVSAENFHDSLTRLAAKLSGAGWEAGAVTQELLNALKSSTAASPEHPRHDRWKDLMSDKSGELSRIVNTGHKKYNSFSVSDDFSHEEFDTEKLQKLAKNFGFKAPAGGNEPLKIRKIEDFVGWPFEGEGYFAHADHDLLSQRFVMHPMLCEDESVLVAAEPKTGKTAICLTVALHIACGLDLGESLKVAEPRSVLYFGLEGRRAIRLRIAAWRQWQSQNGIELPTHIPLFVVEKPKNLLPTENRQELANQIKAAELHLKQEGKPDLGAIFIDTFTKSMPGGDQNSVDDTSAVFDVVHRIRDHDCTAAVVFIHHKARAGNVRGSTNIEADPDVLTSINKEGSTVRWNLDRARSVEEGGSYHFKLHNFALGESVQGFAINAPVVEAIDAETASTAATEIGEAKLQSQQLALIVSLGAGTHAIKIVCDILWNAGIGPVKIGRSGKTKPRVNTATVQEFFEKLIPDTGYVFQGKSVEKVRDVANMVTGVLVR